MINIITKFKKRCGVNKILLYYSTFLLTALIIGGFSMARAANEIVSNILLLPVAVFLWINVVQRFKATRKIKKLKVMDLDKDSSKI
ncbi:MAG: hypothetical protein AAB516_02235 [Patescibacteria group bacterium]